MRVLMIGTDRRAFLASSDSRRRLQELAGHLTSLTVIVFSLRAHGLATVTDGNLCILPTNSIGRWLYFWSAFRLGRGVEKVDLVTTQDPFECGLAGWLLSRSLTIPWQAQIHTSLFSPYFYRESWLNRLRVNLARRLLPRADQVRVVSQQIATSLEQEGLILKQRPGVLPVFVDRERLLKAPIDHSLVVRYRVCPKLALMISRLSREKNIDLALHSFALLVGKDPTWGLIIVGDGPERQRLERLRERLGLGGKVFFAGWSDHPADFYRLANVFLLTSNYEGFNRTLVEARIFNLPIVSTDVGGAWEVGAKIVSRHPEEIAKALAQSLQSDTEKTDSPPPWLDPETYWRSYVAMLPTRRLS